MMKRQLYILFPIAVLSVGAIVKAQTGRGKAVPKVSPVKARDERSAVTVANPEPTGPGAVELDHQMRQSFKWSSLGRKALSHSDFVTAEKCFRQALAAYPRSSEAQTGLGQALDKQGRTAEATAAYDKAYPAR